MDGQVVQEFGNGNNVQSYPVEYPASAHQTAGLNGHGSQGEIVQNGNSDPERLRRGTSSPSGRSASVHSGRSDSSRRRVESDTIKEPSARNSVSKGRRRNRESASPGKHRGRSRTPSPSPKRRRRNHSDESKSRSRSQSRSRSRHSDKDRSRTRSRSRHSDRQRRNGRGVGRGGRDDRPSRRSRSRSRTRSPRRSRSPRGYGGPRGHYGRNSERDNPKPSRCVGIFGLSTRTREKDVRAVFEKYGPLDNVQLIHDHMSGRSRGFGFVYFTYVNDAEDAKNDANGMLLDDRRIRVDFSLTQRNHAAGVKRSRERSPRRSRTLSPSRERRRSRSRSLRD